MFNIMICNITKIRIRLSICTSSEVVLSSICSLTIGSICREQGMKNDDTTHRVNVLPPAAYN